MSIDQAYRILYSLFLMGVSVLLVFCLIRTVIGPRVTDRIISVNMIGTLVISSIAVLSLMLDESYLVDVALIYAMISFVVVLMLAQIYIPKKPPRAIRNPEAFQEYLRERGKDDE